MAKTSSIDKHLGRIFDNAPAVPLEHDAPVVIFSDLHMGDGGGTDDFKRNAGLFGMAARDYYLARGYRLVLNGDIEELQRFSLKKIRKRWHETYALFDRFAEQDRFCKTIGNHDLALLAPQYDEYPYALSESLKLTSGDNTILVLHGHQTSNRFHGSHHLVGMTLKYVANPLRIKNYSVSHSSGKRFKVERRIYRFSCQRKTASVIGHTHRPLFESLSKQQRLVYRIEQLCRDYAGASQAARPEIEAAIAQHRSELEAIEDGPVLAATAGGLYQAGVSIPCLFNSGCVVGKRGMTCIEIAHGAISLVHWFDRSVSKRYLNRTGYEPERLGQSDVYRMVINSDDLDYVFGRIRLLT